MYFHCSLKNIILHKIIIFILIVFSVNFAYSKDQDNKTPVFIHFFDWFHENNWQEDKFVDKFNWEMIGIKDKNRSSEDFYFKQFSYMKSIGIDALAWEYHIRYPGKEATYPSKEAIKALERSGLKIAPFYDWEISAKVRSQSDGKLLPNFSNPNSIQPNEDTAKKIADDLAIFYQKIPSNLIAIDKKGRQVIFGFGYGFDDSNPDPKNWNNFAKNLKNNLLKINIKNPNFYWTAKNSVFIEHLFLHHREMFTPFHFVLDTPQSQFSHDSVTWNFGFDNLGVQKLYGMQRVIRLDKRYIEEMGWLSKATDPSLVFIYSWNEPFEGSNLLPTVNWSDTKSRLAKKFIERMRSDNDTKLPKTLLIVDDLDDYWGKRKGDWHLVVLREMLLYSMRRFAPQADVRLKSELNTSIIDEYKYIIDATTEKSDELQKILLKKINSHRILFFDPIRARSELSLAKLFGEVGESISLNSNVKIVENDKFIFVRDDIIKVTACNSCKALVNVKIPWKVIGFNIPFFSKLINPIVISKGNNVWVNAYSSDENILSVAFEAFYGEPMNNSIMYGEGLLSQRLEIDGKSKKKTYNTLLKKSINGHWKIPDDIQWNIVPPEVEKKDIDFIFGK